MGMLFARRRKKGSEMTTTNSLLQNDTKRVGSGYSQNAKNVPTQTRTNSALTNNGARPKFKV